MTPNKRKGFTLLELLTVIAIIAITASILFPVVGRAKLRAYNTSHIASLRQLGQAREIYAPETTDKLSFQSEPLVRTGLLSPALLDSKFDPFVEGCMNHRKSYDFESSQGITPYKDSLLTAPAYIGSLLLNNLQQRRQGGWAVFQASPPQQQNDVPWNQAFEIYSPRFLRLRFDGSVVSGSLVQRPAKAEPHQLAIFPEDLFYDESE